MPELPEVETIRRVIEPQIKGLSIEQVAVRRSEVVAHPTADEFCRQWYWREENKTQKQRQPQNKRKSLLSFLRSFL